MLDSIQKETPPKSPASLAREALEDWKAIDQRVGHVRARHGLKFIAVGLLACLALFAAAFLGFSAVDVLFKLSIESRIFWMTVTGVGLLAVLFLLVIRPWRQLGGSLFIARQIEDTFPELNQQLSTSLEYGQNPQLLADVSSPELVGALLKQTKKRSEPLNFGRTIRWRPVLIAALLAFLISGGVALYAGYSQRLFSVTWERFIRPTANIPAPTLTVIQEVRAGENRDGDGEVPVETSVPIAVTLSGMLPDTAKLSVCMGDPETNLWEDRLMERGEDGIYRATLRRLLDTAHYRVSAGDAESRAYRIDVYRIPQIDEFRVRLEYPEYTGRKAERKPPGSGHIEALRGTKAVIQLTANTDLAEARVVFTQSHARVNASFVKGRRAELAFELKENDSYQIQIENTQGRGNQSPDTYRIKVFEDGRPAIRIMKPEKDLLVHKEQEVKVELSATDDIGVREIGICHSLGVDEEKTMVKRFEPCPLQGQGYLKWELANLGLKGGEVIAYYAYALDNDTLAGPKQAKSGLHFLTVYDEEEYESVDAPGSKSQPTPQSVRNVDKMIDEQKNLLKETFALARIRENAKEPELGERETTVAAKTAKAQRSLKKKIEALVEQLKAEIESAPEMPEPKPEDELDGGDPPPAGHTPFGEKELGHMVEATKKMDGAAEFLDEGKAAPAVSPEMEALRHLSEARRLLLSEKEGDPRFKMAMDRQAKKNRRQNRSQQEQDQNAAREELSKLPPMMEREKKLERDLETLDELDQALAQPPQPDRNEQAEEEKEEERRRLRRQVQEELDQLAQEAQEREKELRELAHRNPEMAAPADQMKEAKEQLDKAQEASEKSRQQEAQQEARQAGRNMEQARKGLRDAMQKQLRQEMANLHRDARDLSERQASLGKEALDHLRQQQEPADSKSSQKPEEKSGENADEKSGDKTEQSTQGDPQPQDGSQAGQEREQGQQPGPSDSQQTSPGSPSGLDRAQAKAMATRQQEVGEDLTALSEQLDDLARRAAEDASPGTKAIQEASRQAGSQSSASQSAESALKALQSGDASEAEREQQKATRALEAMARQLQEAIQKTAAADIGELAKVLKKVKGLVQDQEKVRGDLANRRDPAELAKQEERVADAADELSNGVRNLEALKQSGRARQAEDQLKNASAQARKAAEALAGQDTKSAQEPAEKAGQALESAANQLDRAVGKSLEEKARQALVEARSGREEQERAAQMVRQLPDPAKQEGKDKGLSPDAAAKRDEAVDRERNAARSARRLEKALEGLEQIAQEANPAASQVAREASETMKDQKLPLRMDDLAKAIEEMGRPAGERASQSRQPMPPGRAGEQGEALAEQLKSVEKKLNQFVSEAAGDWLSKLQSMEQETRDAARQAEQMAGNEQDPREPSDPENQNEKNPEKSDQKGKQQSEHANKWAHLEKSLKNLDPKLDRLEPGAPERAHLKDAMKSLQQARTASPGNQAGGQVLPRQKDQKGTEQDFKRTKEALDEVASGLVGRIERILKAREIRPGDDEEAPKEYQPLVEKYYRALSEDMDDDE